MKRGLATLAVLVLLVIAVLTWLNHDRPDVAALLPAAPEATADDGENGLNITFLGTSTVLLDDGETQLLTDGYFTRPGLLSLLGEVSSDHQIVEGALAQYDIGERLAAVIPVHSHHDHAMDSALVAELTGADMLGSPSSAVMARSAELPEAQIKTAEDGQSYSYGRFRVTLIESKHVPMPGLLSGWIGMGQAIEEAPGKQPKLGDYHQGIAWTVLVEHPEGRVLIQGSAGFKPGQFEGIELKRPVDLALVGLAGLSKQDETYNAQYWREIVGSTQPRVIAPIHWDDFTRPLSTDLPAMPRLVDDLEKTIGNAQKRLESNQRLIYLQPTRHYHLDAL
ncbi:MAG: MBL fold metallo-hydrolase [Pseudomonadota bacterium]